MGNTDECQNSLPLFSDTFDVNEKFHIPVHKAMSQFYYHIFPALKDDVNE